MTKHAVVIAGAGPTGLMLAGELALAGIDVAAVERRTDQELNGSRAGGLHSRTIEILDQRGIADRFLSEGQTAQVAGFAWIPLDISDFPTRHNYGLALRQRHVERILAGWVEELSVPIYRGIEVTGFAQDDSGVNVEISNGEVLRAEFLVGCDGGRSLIRKAAGIEFPGWAPTLSSLIAEAETTEEPQWGKRSDAKGAIGKLEDGRVGIMVNEPRVGTAGEPTLRDLSEALVAVYGTDYGVHSATSISRFTDMARQAASYRDRQGIARRGRRARSRSRWRSRSQHRRPRRCKSWMEARASGPANVARDASGYVPGRASSDRCARLARYDGAIRAAS
jgi:2-polyprenyl-6-methoxyphenol hydroxylase-like FAD-dependent oxidoreductase